MRALAVHARSWEQIVLIYAGQQMADDVPLREYHVPPVRLRVRRACASRPGTRRDASASPPVG